MSFTVLRFKRYRDDDAPDLLCTFSFLLYLIHVDVGIRDPKKSKHIDLSSPKRDIAIFRKVDKDDLLRKLEESSRVCIKVEIFSRLRNEDFVSQIRRIAPICFMIQTRC